MQENKQETTGQEALVSHQQNIICLVCGREIKSDTCNWQADDGDGMHCEECWAERESCGCSD
jgi:hypothetical protein